MTTLRNEPTTRPNTAQSTTAARVTQRSWQPSLIRASCGVLTVVLAEDRSLDGHDRPRHVVDRAVVQLELLVAAQGEVLGKHRPEPVVSTVSVQHPVRNE